MDNSTASQQSGPAQPDDLKLQLLQLQCIIDAKDREIKLLRKQFSSPEGSDEAALHAEVAHLRGEVKQLTVERDALRAQPGAATSRSAGAAAAQASGIQQQGAAVAGNHQRANPPLAGGSGAQTGPAIPADSKFHPVSPTVGLTVDSGALVEKLRALVNSLVAEALAAQLRFTTEQQHPHQPPIALLSSSTLSSSRQPSSSQRYPGPHANHTGQSAVSSPCAGGQSRPQLASQCYAASASLPVRPTLGEAEQQLSLPPPPAVTAPTAATAPLAALAPLSASDALTASVHAAWPAVHVIVQQIPSMLQPTVTASGETLTELPGSVAIHRPKVYTAPVATSAATKGATKAAAPTAAASVPTQARGGYCRGGDGDVDCGATAPAVLELNVDGTVVLVERAVLESQAAGTLLHRMLIQEYAKLPRDSKGRPYLSYEPHTFQLLMSVLKERYLFGTSGAGRSGARDSYWQIVEARGLQRHYFLQAAAHFGLTDLVTPLQPEDTTSNTAAACTVNTAAAAATTGPYGAVCGPMLHARHQLLDEPLRDLTTQTGAGLSFKPSASDPPRLCAPAPVAGGPANQQTLQRPLARLHLVLPAPPVGSDDPTAPQDQIGPGAAGVVAAPATGEESSLGGSMGQQLWDQLPSVRVRITPHHGAGNSGDLAVDANNGVSGMGDVGNALSSCTASADPAAISSPRRSAASGPPLSPPSPSPPPQQQKQQGPGTVNRQTSTSSPSSRIPPAPAPLPLPLQQRPAPAPLPMSAHAIPAAANVASEASEASFGTTRESSGTGPAASSWWQPFPDEQREASATAVTVATAAVPSSASTAAAIAAAAVASAAERYRVPNLYEVLAKKQRLEFESAGGASN